MLALIWEMGGFGRQGWGVVAAIVKGVNSEVFWVKGVWKTPSIIRSISPIVWVATTTHRLL